MKYKLIDWIVILAVIASFIMLGYIITGCAAKPRPTSKTLYEALDREGAIK